MKKGIVAGKIGDMSFGEVLDLYRRAGFDGIEISISEEAGSWVNLESSEADLAGLRSEAERAGVEIHSIMGGLLWKYPLSSPDEGIRKKGMEIVRKAIWSAKLLGADTVLVVPGVVNPETGYDYAYGRSLEALKELSGYAEDNGISLAVENVWNKFLLSPLEMRDFIDAIESRYVGAYFDVGNVVISGYPEQWIRILGDRIRKIHLKDFKSGQGFVYLLQGDVNWPEVRKAMAEVGYDGYLTAELSPYRYYPERMLEETSKHISAIFGI